MLFIEKNPNKLFFSAHPEIKNGTVGNQNKIPLPGYHISFDTLYVKKSDLIVNSSFREWKYPAIATVVLNIQTNNSWTINSISLDKLKKCSLNAEEKLEEVIKKYVLQDLRSKKNSISPATFFGQPVNSITEIYYVIENIP